MSDCPEISCCPPGPFDNTIPQPPVPLVWNVQRCKTAHCPAGTTGPDSTKCIAANTYSAGNLADANALADAAAQELATAGLVCVPDQFGNEAQFCIASCVAPQVGPDVRVDIAANDPRFFASTQAEANSLAYAAACAEATSALSCNTNITAALNGLIWKVPPTGSPDHPAPQVDPSDQIATITGEPGRLYNVQILIRGITEIKYDNGIPGSYVPGTNTNMFDFTGVLTGNSHSSGMAIPADPRDEYALIVSDPYKVYLLNFNDTDPPYNLVFVLTYLATIQMRTGATIKLTTRLVDYLANRNDGPPPLVVPTAGLPPITAPPSGVVQPYLGQFVQLDVISIT